ncbi:MAG: glycosyltransferase family 4 protein [Balneolales bacterium]
MKTTSEASRSIKNVLIVTYYWPPSGGAGVQRFLKFVKYLPQFDIRPVVLTCSNPTYPILDPSLVEDIPSTVQVYKSRSLEPFKLYSRLAGISAEKAASPTIALSKEHLSVMQRAARFIRANLFIPDARLGWVPFARKKALHLIRTHNIDRIITTGPPHSTHFIGLWIKQKTGITWIADFRDPWSDIHYNRVLPRTGLAKMTDHKLELKILKHADHITVTAPGTAALITRNVSRSCHVITNGFDPDDFDTSGYPPTHTGRIRTSDSGSEFSPVHPETGNFLIRHVGSITETSVPENLFQALSRLQSLPVRMEFIGSSHEMVQFQIREHGIESIVKQHPYVPHKEAIRLMQQSDMNVVVVHRSDDSRILIPGKLFDYLKAGKPIMIIGPVDGDAAEIVRKCNIGKAFDYDDYEGPADWIRTLFHSNKSTHGSPLHKPEERLIASYSRYQLTARLAEIIHHPNTT